MSTSHRADSPLSPVSVELSSHVCERVSVTPFSLFHSIHSDARVHRRRPAPASTCESTQHTTNDFAHTAVQLYTYKSTVTAPATARARGPLLTFTTTDQINDTIHPTAGVCPPPSHRALPRAQPRAALLAATAGETSPTRLAWRAAPSAFQPLPPYFSRHLGSTDRGSRPRCRADRPFRRPASQRPPPPRSCASSARESTAHACRLSPRHRAATERTPRLPSAKTTAAGVPLRRRTSSMAPTRGLNATTPLDSRRGRPPLYARPLPRRP